MIFIYTVLSTLAAWLTFHILKRPGMSPTRASAAVSLKGILVLLAVNQVYPIEVYELASLVFGASFVGMCSHKIFNDLEILFSGLCFGLLYVYFTPKISGFGGALGFSAFIAVMGTRVLFMGVAGVFRKI